MIEHDGRWFPEAQVLRITERTKRQACKDGKPTGYDTEWTLTLANGPAMTSYLRPSQWQVIPNHTPVRALVVTRYDDGSFEVTARPVLAWRVDALAEPRDSFPADALLPEGMASNAAHGLIDTTTGHAWRKGDWSTGTRDDAVEIIPAELTERAAERERKLTAA